MSFLRCTKLIYRIKMQPVERIRTIQFMSEDISELLEWKPKNQEDAKRPDPIDGLGRVGKIQEFLEDLDQLLGSNLPGILLVLELLSNTLNMFKNSFKLLLILLTVHQGHQQSKRGPHWSLINQYLSKDFITAHLLSCLLQLNSNISVIFKDKNKISNRVDKLNVYKELTKKNSAKFFVC